MPVTCDLRPATCDLRREKTKLISQQQLIISEEAGVCRLPVDLLLVRDLLRNKSLGLLTI